MQALLQRQYELIDFLRTTGVLERPTPVEESVGGGVTASLRKGAGSRKSIELDFTGMGEKILGEAGFVSVSAFQIQPCNPVRMHMIADRINSIRELLASTAAASPSGEDIKLLRVLGKGSVRKAALNHASEGFLKQPHS